MDYESKLSDFVAPRETRGESVDTITRPEFQGNCGGAGAKQRENGLSLSHTHLMSCHGQINVVAP